MASRNRRGGRLWSELSPSYRARLRGAGIDQAKWLSGADLRGARSHRAAVPASAAPKEAEQRLVKGEATMADVEVLEAWHRTMAPSWLTGTDRPPLAFDIMGSDSQKTVRRYEPSTTSREPTMALSLDVAVALSQIPIPPTRWGAIEFIPRAGGETWTMIITPKQHTNKDGTVRTHAYDIEIEIPGGGAKGTTGAREVLDWLASGNRSST